MTKIEATAEVFWAAFKGLTRKERQAFVRLALSDEDLRSDLLDLATIESRRHEPERPFRDYR